MMKITARVGRPSGGSSRLKSRRRAGLSAPHRRSAILAALALCSAAAGGAAGVQADPANYRALLRTMKPGDTLHLAPGKYPTLPVMNLNGTPDGWITIAGPASGASAVIEGAPASNTVEIVNSSYVAIRNLRIDSRGIPGVFGISAKGRESNRTHHIRIEGNVLVGQNGGQQTVGISTKTPTWGWEVRHNQIIGAGTGIYLGDSDGTQPFVAGLVENNLIKDTIGYNMQIKDQIQIPEIEGMPLGPSATIIRHNVFIKNDQPSPDGDRPNLMLGAFPSTGSGTLNMYEVYGNYFFRNHREALIQAAGRISLHDNLFVDGPYSYPAVVLRGTQESLKIAYVYHNTVYTSGKGIYFGTRALLDDMVAGNLVFAAIPISGQIMRQVHNTVDSTDNASKYVRSPSFQPETMDFYPAPGRCEGPPVDLSQFHTDVDFAADFNGSSKVQAKGAVVFRGAYAGEGANPGWRLSESVKPPHSSLPDPAPTAVWLDPASGEAGRSHPVMLTGTNFMAGASIVFSGEGVTAGEVRVISATQIGATVKVANASAGIREVTVKTPFGDSNALKFKVFVRRGRNK